MRNHNVSIWGDWTNNILSVSFGEVEVGGVNSKNKGTKLVWKWFDLIARCSTPHNKDSVLYFLLTTLVGAKEIDAVLPYQVPSPDTTSQF